MINRRPFGRTGLFVSEIGFGCGPTARLMVAGETAARRRVVARALELGINYFDTAARYGDGASESNLGQVLRELSAEPVVASKIVIGTDDLADVAGAVERAVEASLKRLGRDRIEIVHLHNRVGRQRTARANIGADMQLGLADILGRNGVAEGFERLRRRGLVGFAGCSAYGGEMDAVSSLIESGLFASVLVNYSLLNPSAWFRGPRKVDVDYRGVAAEAARRGCATVALRVLEGGALAGCDPRGDERGRLQPFAFLLEENPDFAGAAIRFALSNPAVSTVLVGISSEDQLQAAVAAAERGPLSAAALARIAASG